MRPSGYHKLLAVVDDGMVPYRHDQPRLFSHGKVSVHRHFRRCSPNPSSTPLRSWPPFDHVADQYEFRKELVIKTLEHHSVAMDSPTGTVSRGGLLTPIQAGAYEVNDDMVWQLKNRPQNEHASNVGAMIARALAVEHHIPVFIYDGITVDELTPINKIILRYFGANTTWY